MTPGYSGRRRLPARPSRLRQLLDRLRPVPVEEPGRHCRDEDAGYRPRPIPAHLVTFAAYQDHQAANTRTELIPVVRAEAAA